MGFETFGMIFEGYENFSYENNFFPKILHLFSILRQKNFLLQNLLKSASNEFGMIFKGYENFLGGTKIFSYVRKFAQIPYIYPFRGQVYREGVKIFESGFLLICYKYGVLSICQISEISMVKFRLNHFAK